METKKIGEIREEFKAAEETMLPSFIEKYRSDERAAYEYLNRNPKAHRAGERTPRKAGGGACKD